MQTCARHFRPWLGETQRPTTHDFRSHVVRRIGIELRRIITLNVCRPRMQKPGFTNARRTGGHTQQGHQEQKKWGSNTEPNTEHSACLKRNGAISRGRDCSDESPKLATPELRWPKMDGYGVSSKAVHAIAASEKGEVLLLRALFDSNSTGSHFVAESRLQEAFAGCRRKTAYCDVR